MLLSIDTSLPIFSAAIVKMNGALVGAVSMEGEGSRNEKLLPAVDFLLQENAITRKDLTLLAGTRGPGSFTGVRIGLATLHGLALALGIPLRAFTTHEAISEVDIDGTYTVMGDAGRGEVYATDFRGGVAMAGPEIRLRASTNARYEAETFVHQGNIALLSARRALRLRELGTLESFSDATPSYVRLAEAESKLLQSRNG